MQGNDILVSLVWLPTPQLSDQKTLEWSLEPSKSTPEWQACFTVRSRARCGVIDVAARRTCGTPRRVNDVRNPQLLSLL